LEKTAESIADLFVAETLATIESRLAPLYGFDEAIFFLEVSRDDFLHNFIGKNTLLGCPLCKACLQSGIELDFHNPQDTKKGPPKQMAFPIDHFSSRPRPLQ